MLLFTFISNHKLYIHLSINFLLSFLKILRGCCMPIFCQNCGAQLDDDAGFCTNCGTRIGSIQPPVNWAYPVSVGRDSNVKISNFVGENDNIIILDEKGPFSVIEYEKDLSITPREAMIMYFSSKMNIRPRQLVVDLSKLVVFIFNQDPCNG